MYDERLQLPEIYNAQRKILPSEKMWPEKPVPSLNRRPAVTEILEIWGPWPCCMGLIGECEDGIPLAARFYSPKEASHFVFYGQDDVVLATLVEPLLYSMTVQNWEKSKFQFIIVSERTTEWNVSESEYCASLLSPYRRNGESIISRMAGLAEQRMMGQVPLSPRYLLVLHDLGRYWDYWRSDPKRDIIPLLRDGHKFGINVVASIRYEDYEKIPEKVRSLLRQKVYGYSSVRRLPNNSAFRQIGNVLSAEIAPYQAWVRSEGKWMRYTTPIMA